MHEHVRAFVKSAVEAFALAGPVYEFGFCPANPMGRAALRDCFPDSGYIGCDLCDEGDADHRERFARLPFADGVARTVVCVNVLGHVLDPRKTAKELTRLLAPGGGILIVSTLDARSWDRRRSASRLQPGLIRQLLPGLEIPVVGWQGDLEAPHTVYAAGFKPPLTVAVLGGTQRLLQDFPARLDRLARLPETFRCRETPPHRNGGALGGGKNFSHDVLAGGDDKPLRLRDYLAIWCSRRLRQRGQPSQVEFVIDLPRGTTLQVAPAEYSAGATGTRLDLTDGG